jgi:sugar lactone lactonase YvrE
VQDAVFLSSRLVSFELAIGESPVWDSSRQCLWFVDILAPAIYEFEPTSGRLHTHKMPAAIGSLGLAKGGRLIVALRTGVYFYDPESRSFDFLVHPEPDMPANRLNDGKVGPDGCFWVGSMHEAVPRSPTGSLYRVSPDGSFSKVLDGINVSNGLAWSPDGNIMYHADSRGDVRAYDFDVKTSKLSGMRVLLTPTENEGLADGAAVDAEGYYWSAGVTASCLNKISSTGDIVAKVALPVLAPTMPCFGGCDLRTMFVTSLTATRGGRHDPGTLVSLEMDVPGAAVSCFG